MLACPMKWRTTILTLGVILALVLAADLWRGRKVTLRWDYDYVKDPPCELQQKRVGPCVLGFNIFLKGITGSANRKFVANRFDSGRVLGRDLQVTLPVHSYGQVEFCVVSVAKDEKGSSIESLPTCGTRLLLPFGIK